jgi:hypothetical protein
MTLTFLAQTASVIAAMRLQVSQLVGQRNVAVRTRFV